MLRKLRDKLLRPRLQDKKLNCETAMPDRVEKAGGDDFLGRFREIVSDPLNLLIERVPCAGMVENNLVWLHNGNRVSIKGRDRYYGRLSNVLIINRGVHEPVEEYVFQEVMRLMPEDAIMLELGAYWSHYSMWMKRKRPRSRVFMVEPHARNLKVGQTNFARNGFEGTFIRAFVGKQHFTVDHFMHEQSLPKLNILHADIQGYEVEMLEGAAKSFEGRLIDYAFVSTHSEELHDKVVADLAAAGMRVEVSSNVDHETTSCDGFVFASRAELPPVFPGFNAIGRCEIVRSKPDKLVSYLSSLVRDNENAGQGR